MRLPKPMLACLLLLGCHSGSDSATAAATPTNVALVPVTLPAPAPTPSPQAPAGQAIAIFAGGCFWCMVAPFETQAGVSAVVSGYTGGHVAQPSYEQVSSGDTGHAESVEVTFDPSKVSYGQLLQIYWHNIDPTVSNRQFCDSGDQYRTAIFTIGDEQKKQAEDSRDALAASGVLKGAPIVTQIVPAMTFYAAEDYHQDYFKKRDIAYQIYRHGCGRDQRLQAIYGADAPKH